MFHVKHSDALREYCRLLLAAPVSLTAVTDPAAAWELHVLDSLTAMPVIAERAPRTLIDVGSGGGSPGIPIAIETGLAVDLLESRERKSEFLRTTVEALGLPCGVITERSEDFARADGRDRYDMALARALAPPPVALELCLPLVRSGGTVILWMGMVPLEPLAQRVRRALRRDRRRRTGLGHASAACGGQARGHPGEIPAPRRDGGQASARVSVSRETSAVSSGEIVSRETLSGAPTRPPPSLPSEA